MRNVSRFINSIIKDCRSSKLVRGMQLKFVDFYVQTGDSPVTFCQPNRSKIDD